MAWDCCRQLQKALNRIDSRLARIHRSQAVCLDSEALPAGEYIVLCYGLDPHPKHVVDVDVIVKGWLKASRTVSAVLWR